MKPVLLLFTLLILGIAGNAATVSGHLSHLGTSAAIPYYRVYLTDSSATSIIYRDSTFSDAAGNYSFTIPAFVTTGNMIAWIQACGSRIASISTFSGSSLTINLAACSSSTATISGTVTAWSAGSVSSPVYNKTVYIVDSTSAYYHVDSVLSEYDGHYSYTVPASITSNVLKVYTSDPIFNASVMVNYSGANLSGVDLWVTYKKHRLWGKTTLGGSPNNGPTKLYLIRKAYDAVLMDTTLTAIDSFNTIGNTGCFNKEYDSSVYSLTNGVNPLLVKAALMPAHTSYAAYLPAYSHSSLNWNGASRIDSSEIYPSGSNFKMANIDLPAGINPGGSGFIGGSVLLGANKSTAVGDPLASRVLLLTTASGQAVGYTKSDAAGQFKFPNLAYGSYLIFGDAWGKTNPPLAVTLSAGKATANNIVFEENSKSFTGHLNTLSINSNPTSSFINLYPNPVHNYVLLTGLDAIGGDRAVVIRGMNGAMLSKTPIRGGSSVSVNTSDLPAGIYLLQVQSGTGVFNFKFIKD